MSPRHWGLDWLAVPLGFSVAFVSWTPFTRFPDSRLSPPAPFVSGPSLLLVRTRRRPIAPAGKLGPDPASWQTKENNRGNMNKRTGLFLTLFTILILATACGGDDGPVLRVGGIPDQDASRLARRYDQFSDYLSNRLGVKVEYVPATDYAAVVTAFVRGDVQLAFFGGFTGYQARLSDPGSEAIAQREQDAKFTSDFIVGPSASAQSLEELKSVAGEITFTFGSESSTSGHLMPRFFMEEIGLDPDTDFKTVPNYSGSHDLTWRLVESGAFNAGVLNHDVWQRAVDEHLVDTDKVRELERSPEYFDYNWTVRADLDEEFRVGFKDEIQAALLEMDENGQDEILELFSTSRFIESNNANYRELEQVIKELELGN